MFITPILEVEDLSHAIRETRGRSSYTLQRVAEESGVSAPVITKLESDLANKDVDFFSSVYRVLSYLDINLYLMEMRGSEEKYHSITTPAEFLWHLKYGIRGSIYTQDELADLSGLSLSSVKKLCAIAEMDPVAGIPVKDIRLHSLLKILPAIELKLCVKVPQLVEAGYSVDVNNLLKKHLKEKEIQAIEQFNGSDISVFTNLGFPHPEDHDRIAEMKGSAGTPQMRAAMLCMLSLHMQQENKNYENYSFGSDLPYALLIERYLPITIGTGKREKYNDDLIHFLDEVLDAGDIDTAQSFIKNYIIGHTSVEIVAAGEIIDYCLGSGLELLLAPNRPETKEYVSSHLVSAIDYASLSLCRYLVETYSLTSNPSKNYMQAISERFLRKDRQNKREAEEILAYLLRRKVITKKDMSKPDFMGYGVKGLLSQVDHVATIDRLFCQYAGCEPGEFYKKLIFQAYRFSMDMRKDNLFLECIDRYLDPLTKSYQFLDLSELKGIALMSKLPADYISIAYEDKGQDLVARAMVQLSLSTPDILGDSIFQYLMEIHSREGRRQ